MNWRFGVQQREKNKAKKHFKNYLQHLEHAAVKSYMKNAAHPKLQKVPISDLKTTKAKNIPVVFWKE